jgi:hypothetical protein
MKRINIFATKSDWLLVLSEIEARQPIKYIRAGMLTASTPEVWRLGADLPKLGDATGDQAVACDPYLIMEEKASLHVRSSIMSDGKTRFDVDQLNNEDSVVIWPGGKWGTDVLISGSIATVSASSIAQGLMRAAHATIKKHFVRVQAFWGRARSPCCPEKRNASYLRCAVPT